VVSIDLNADLGEVLDGVPTDDAGLVEVVTSANIACGFHSGDAVTMAHACRLCVDHDVVIGAQVSYRDREGFGRRFVDVEPAVLTADVLEQLETLDEIAHQAGGRVSYVKPHGALYNAIVHHEGQAAAVVTAVLEYDGRLPVLGLPGSRWLDLAEQAGLRTVREAFADRGYAADGSLVPRGEPRAVLADLRVVVQRCVRLATAGEVVAADGTVLRVDPDSICLHGDTPGAVSLARAVRSSLVAAGVEPAPFVRLP
jgi:5-oxoprolinase (ATP-hydrolysing) subunit A